MIKQAPIHCLLFCTIEAGDQGTDSVKRQIKTEKTGGNSMDIDQIERLKSDGD